MKREYRAWSLLEKRAAVDRIASVRHGELAAVGGSRSVGYMPGGTFLGSRWPQEIPD